jgi:hypothetical protein
VAHEGGLLRYLALHFLKESQRPPEGWKGHRVTRSRGYLTLPTWRARAEAKAALRLKREIYKAESAGYEGAEVLAVAELAVLAAASVEWLLVEIEVSDAGELVAIRPALGGGMPGPRRDTAARRRAAEPSLDDLESLDDYCASLDRHEGIGGSEPNAPQQRLGRNVPSSPAGSI